MERLLIISADNHAGAKVAEYAPYLEEKYREALPKAEQEEAEFLSIYGAFNTFPQEALDVIDDRNAIRSGGFTGAWDASRRLKEMDAEGVTAEIVHAGHQAASMPFFSQVNKQHPPELRAAGARAYHRWFADRIARADGQGRIYGVGDPGPALDMAATVRELNWLADNGFVSVGVPGIVKDEHLPPLFDAHFAPFWATCAERGLVLSVHAGWGAKQGIFFDYPQILAGDPNVMEAMMRGDLKAVNKIVRESNNSPFALDLGPRQAFWQLILGGVFDRHPTLKLAFTEVRADWLPATLAYLDLRFEQQQTSAKLKPSEYFHRQCYVAPSSPRRNEIEIRHEIGVDRFLFGVDYPHPEGTWPNTKEWIRTTLGDLPESEARMILGENAIECYKLDRNKLTAVASRIGLSPTDVLGRREPIDDRMVAHWDERSGYNQAPEVVDLSKLGSAVDADLRSISS
jgi:predicted TIM-barrel fold metal-dependent hydrolase